MKTFFASVILLVNTSLFAQLTPGVYEYAKVTVDVSGNISAVETMSEIDPTVDINIKNITNADFDKWYKGYEAWQWGNPASMYVAFANTYNNPQWITGLARTRIDWGGTNLQYVGGDGSIITMPSFLLSSVASSTYQPLLGFTPVPNTRTVNGKALSSNVSLTKSDISDLTNVDNTSDANKPISSATQTALNTKQATLISGTNIKTVGGVSILGSGDVAVGSGTVTSVTAGTGLSGGTINTSGSISIPNSGVTAGTYEYVTVNSLGIVTGGYNSVVSDVPSRTSGTAYQASNTSRIYDLDFTLTITIGATLISASDAQVVLEISANGTTGWSEYTRGRNANSGVLAAQNIQTSYIEATGIPAGYFYRLVYTNNVGTTSWTYVKGHEILRR